MGTNGQQLQRHFQGEQITQSKIISIQLLEGV